MLFLNATARAILISVSAVSSRNRRQASRRWSPK